jgi:transcriptional regulator with XRE-family HTH domain
MASLPDPHPLGKAIRNLRRSHGLTLKQVVGRVLTHYADETALGRVERGVRMPDRERVLAILATGIGVTKSEVINDVLALGGYAHMTSDEIRKLSLQATSPQKPVELPIPPDNPFERPVRSIFRTRIAVGLVGGALIVAAAIAAFSGQDAVVVMLTAGLYAGLYAGSVFLESAFEGTLKRVAPCASVVFHVMFFTSVLGLCIDRWTVTRQLASALPMSLLVFLAAAALQWLIARTVLPERAVVPSGLQTMTAQAAHLKNTLYFLIVVIVFWLPPFHCVIVLRREIELGHIVFVREMLSSWLLIGRGIICLSPGILWGFAAGLVPLSLIMAARLLDNLRSHPRQNSFTSLFFVRAALYFLLVLVCLYWYSSEIGVLRQQLQPPAAGSS